MQVPDGSPVAMKRLGIKKPLNKYPFVGPRKQLKQIIHIEHNTVTNPNWRQTSWLFTIVTEDLDSGLP